MSIFNWTSLEAQRVKVAATLLGNITSLKGLLETDGFDDVADDETVTAVARALKELSEQHLTTLTTIANAHAGFNGTVPTERNHEFLFFQQQYHNLNTEMLASLTGLTRILINLKETALKKGDA